MTRRRGRRVPRWDAEDYFEGVRKTLVLQGGMISRDTPLTEVLKFRESNDDQLARLRTSLAGYTSRFFGVADDDALWPLAHDIYANELAPQLTDLEARLNKSPIDFAVAAIKTSALTSLASAPVASALSSFVGPWAVRAAAGLSVVLSCVQHFRDHAELRRTHPMSFVLPAQRRLGR